MNVLICGSRDFDERALIFRRMIALTREKGAENLTLIHGDARGADRLAAACARQLLWREIKAYPADWDKYGKRAGFVRNNIMLVDGNPDLVIGFKNRAYSAGTDMMINLAREAGVETEVHFSGPFQGPHTHDPITGAPVDKNIPPSAFDNANL